MATSNFTVAPDNTSDVNFRLWGKGIQDAMTAVGLVQTTDTGQIDWTTVNRPIGVLTMKGYTIHRFSDALQSTKPVFIRIDYGSGAGSQYWPGLIITVGVGTDGAGNLGVNSITSGIRDLRNSTATVSECRCAGASNRVALTLWPRDNSGIMTTMFAVERTKDNAGADTSAGIIVMIAGADTGGNVQQTCYVYDYTDVLWSITGTPGCLPPSSGSTGVDGSNVAIYPLHAYRGGSVQNPFLGIVTYFPADLVAYGSFSATIYGVARNYFPCGSASLNTGIRIGRTNSNLSCCIINE